MLVHTGSAQVQTRSGAGAPIIVTPPGGGTHRPAWERVQGLLPVEPPWRVVRPARGPGWCGRPGGPAGGCAAGAPGQPGGGTLADIVNWTRGISNNALQLAQGALQWMCNGVQAVGNQGNQVVQAHPLAVGVTVTAVAAMTAYYYVPSVVDYAFCDTKCNVDGGGDCRALLSLTYHDAPQSQLDEWVILFMAAENCRTGIRPHQDRVGDLIAEKMRREREERERQAQEQEVPTEEPDGTHPGYVMVNASQ